MAEFRRVRSNSGGGTTSKRHKGTAHQRHMLIVVMTIHAYMFVNPQSTGHWNGHALTQLFTNILCALLQASLSTCSVCAGSPSPSSWLTCPGAFHPVSQVLLSPSAQGQEESNGDKGGPELMVFGRVMCTSVGSRATSSSDLQSSVHNKDAGGRNPRVCSFHLLSCSLYFSFLQSLS